MGNTIHWVDENMARIDRQRRAGKSYAAMAVWLMRQPRPLKLRQWKLSEDQRATALTVLRIYRAGMKYKQN